MSEEIKSQLDYFKDEPKYLRKVIDELKQALKPFQDDYFKGLTMEQIAGLAKKSIRITTYNRKLETALEYIKEVTTLDDVNCTISAEPMNVSKDVLKIINEALND